MTLKPSAWKGAAHGRGEDCYRVGISLFKAPIILESHTPDVASHLWKMSGQRQCEVLHTPWGTPGPCKEKCAALHSTSAAR